MKTNLPLSARSQAGYDGGQVHRLEQGRHQHEKAFKRRWLYLALIPLVFLASVYAWLLTWPNSGRITRANFDKIQAGMTIKGLMTFWAKMPRGNDSKLARWPE